ncbi:MocR-like pyridoxine biosynthesis transcription factor PdxR [Guggenheimella bovis]
MTLHLNDDMPYYKQIVKAIKEDIHKGTLKSFDKLPSKRALSKSLGVSLNTVQSAYEQLQMEGYIDSVERSGYFVTELLPLKEPEEVQEKHRSEPSFLYDFRYHQTEKSSFPSEDWKKISRALQQEDDSLYDEPMNPKGTLELREAIQKHLKDTRAIECDAEDLLILSGTESMYHVLFKLFRSTKIYGVENPGYESLSHFFKHNRESFIPIPLDESGMSITMLERSPVDIACISPSHQFPTGTIMPLKRRFELLEWAGEKKRYIIEDDYDSDFRYDNYSIPALKSFDPNDKVIYMGSFSKSLSPTLRTNYLLLPKKLMRRFEANFSYHSCPVALEIQLVLARFMKEGAFARHINRMTLRYKRKRDTMLAFFKTCKDVSIRGFDAGMHLVLHLNREEDSTFYRKKAEEMGIKVYPISEIYSQSFYIEDNRDFIFGYSGISEEDLEDALNLLKKAWSL